MRNRAQVRVWTSSTLSPDWFKRKAPDEQTNKQVESNVKAIIRTVVKKGDAALIEFTEQFDEARLEAKNLRITAREIKDAYKEVDKEQVTALKFIKNKVAAFEKLTLKQAGFKTSQDGVKVQNVLRPIESVGCYVPGGQAAYPSTLVMTVVPAKAAGVPRIVVCSPPNVKGKVNPLILVAADICGVDEVYRVGGAQAIAALAYGTETMKSVCKIVGPGSKYVTTAKVLVSTDVAIDMPAGPSEVIVLADGSADARLIAYDMVSQAEHGGDSVAGLVTTSEKTALQVKKNLVKLTASAPRGEKVSEALEKYGFIIVCRCMDEAVALVNRFAPEHLEVMAANAEALAEKLIAGLILIGPYSPVALSDYASGTNHVLPTGGFAQAFSGLSALDFTRRVSIVESSKAGLEKVKSNIKIMTEAESLPNHSKAIEARFSK
jgi:histidinol dehydrogenase